MLDWTLCTIHITKASDMLIYNYITAKKNIRIYTISWDAIQLYFIYIESNTTSIFDIEKKGDIELISIRKEGKDLFFIYFKYGISIRGIITF